MRAHAWQEDTEALTLPRASQMLRQRGTELRRLVKVRTVPRVLDSGFAILPARRGVAVQQGTGLPEHWLRRPRVRPWPPGNRPDGPQVGEVVQRGVRHDE